jgi:hypothetical protein
VMRRGTRLAPNGYMVLSDPDKGLVEADTLQCVHCGAHFRLAPGSGNVRGFCGFCMRCNGPICGPRCRRCVPMEQQLENMEAGRPLDYRQIVVGAVGMEGHK